MLELDKRKKSKINTEIDAIIKKNDGIVNKEMIVTHAQKKGTAIHEHFAKHGLFDPTKAMKFAQLQAAGILLTQYRVWVSVEDKEPVKVRALVSLTTDRKQEGGYRPIVSVMRDSEKREIMLEDAKKELAAFKKKYAVLSELAPVFSAIEQVNG